MLVGVLVHVLCRLSVTSVMTVNNVDGPVFVQ